MIATRTTLAALALLLVQAASASTASQLIAARDAWQARALPRLQSIAADMKNDPLGVYPAYWLTLSALDKDDDAQVQRFLTESGADVLTEKIRREWLKKLGKREDWTRFAAEWARLPAAARTDEDVQCYADVLALREGRAVQGLDRFLDARPLGDGCNTLIVQSARRNLVSSEWLWQRVRLLLSGNYLTQARTLAEASGLPLDPKLLANPASAPLDTRPGQEAFVFGVLNLSRSDLGAAARALEQGEDRLTKPQAGFGWGMLALYAARKQQFADARAWFDKADPAQLTRDQWDWWARSLLRDEQWGRLSALIARMPADVAARPVWQYWQARALKAQNRPQESTALLVRAAQARQTFYGLLALEELGTSMTGTPDKQQPSADDIARMKALPAIVRAMALFDIAESAQRGDLRTDATAEWRQAMRDRTDMELLAAAEIARKAGFYDMAIYSAERTREQHDMSLRYIMPYKEATQRQAARFGLDDAWVYGLIRQESRFVVTARSGVGAMGLMQLMPATAREMARKLGLGNQLAVHDIETNIQLGTGYLKSIYDRLGNSAVMATAAYNAGASRARAWQDARPLEGAIYAETIPFSETRDYVQKVLANAAFYATGMGHVSLSLKERLAVIPAR